MHNLERILANFKDKKVVVIGDIMLDKFIEGKVLRISPEAPVPVAKVEKEFNELGGAANVALNIVSLGGKVSLFGFVGRDKSANIILELLYKKKVKSFLDKNSVTTEKTRIFAEQQQLLRLDKEEISEKKFSEKIKKAILEESEKAEIILISDYAKGTITKDLIDLIEKYKNKTIVDPKPKNKSFYKNVFLITPNEKESFELSSCSDVNLAGEIIRKELNSNVLITLGEKGMFLFSDKTFEIPTQAKEVYDVMGAGDTVISTLALSIAAGASLNEAAIIANYAASIAVEKRGTYSVGIKELRDKIFSKESKILQFEGLKKVVFDAKRKGKKIVWTNGCFDLLHIGHVHYLREAKKLGDVLIVGINSDDSVKKLKGENRPIQSELERAEILSSLEFVDQVIIFPELSVEKYLLELKPQFYVKGRDYTLDSLNAEEKKAINSYGGKIYFVPLVQGKSSTTLIEKLSKNNNRN